MYYFMNLLSRRLFTSFGSNYLKASNSYSQLVLSQLLIKSKINGNNFFTNNCINNNAIELSVKSGKLSNLSLYQLMIKRNLSKTSENVSSETNDEKTNDLSNNKPTDRQDLKKSFGTKFKPFHDKDSEVILDVSEELMSQEVKEEIDEQVAEEVEEEFYLYQDKKRKRFDQLDLKRGITGVFDIEELVQLLRDENMRDIAVIRVPKELRYCDYLVLANATSLRHMKAIVEFIKKVYKAKKYRKDPFLEFGGDNCNDWKVVDMKNIVLHLFMKETRDYYDIETLWTVGEKYDEKTQRPETDNVVDIMEKHIKFLQEIKPSF